MGEIISGQPSLMREINRAGMLELIRTIGPISQSEIAKKMNLQMSTISRMTSDLENEELILQEGSRNPTAKGGRKAKLWTLNPEGAFAIGVDLKVDQLIVVLVDLAGNVKEKIIQDCHTNDSDQIISLIVQCIERILSTVDKQKVIGIGIALPGQVNSIKGESVLAVNIESWKNIPIAEKLQEKFGLQVSIDHDMRMMALAEQWFGAGSNFKNVLSLGVRYGIGLGLIIDNIPYRGAHQFAGDIGHTVVDPNGRNCICGRRGCLETIASERAIIQWLNEYNLENDNNFLRKFISSEENLSAKTLYKILEYGEDPVIEQKMQECGHHIGRTLSNLVRIIDPDSIIVGGELFESSPLLLETVKASYAAEQPNYATSYPDIYMAELGTDGVAIGASLLILSTLFRGFNK